MRAYVRAVHFRTRGSLERSAEAEAIERVRPWFVKKRRIRALHRRGDGSLLPTGLHKMMEWEGWSYWEWRPGDWGWTLGDVWKMEQEMGRVEWYRY